MEKGLTYTSQTTVCKGNTALTLGSGDMEVFATPALVALMENAAMNAVKPYLPKDSTTVGAMIQTSHIKPSGLGEVISATAILEEEEGRKLTFKVSASDSKGIIGEGIHIRYIVVHYSLNIFSEIPFYELSLYIRYLQMFSFDLNTHEISLF